MDNDVIRKVAEPVRQFQTMAEAGYAMIVPPLDPQAAPAPLANRRGQSAGVLRTGKVHPAMTWFAAMATAYRQQQAPGILTVPWRTTRDGSSPNSAEKCSRAGPSSTSTT